MAKGKQGFMLEFYKFGVYLMIPIGASMWYNDPTRQKANADYWQFIKYPPSDPEKVREEVQDRIAREQKQKEQQKAYLEQMKRLQASADRSRDYANNSDDGTATTSSSGGSRLWGWLGFRSHQNQGKAEE